ncbi:hypothetical protein B0H67DRAFT_558290 [Lasiosphaeris hirsuta]|uniref:Uncharacterized protein n=1 Tax=Lasiosphaeris hirsuta TaxID=260670 RepID=A0AA40DIK1_9PEZI|nr:hypothetical protein B0H67DRAFT_558290 [Lasiosphaeris hirsuta]
MDRSDYARIILPLNIESRHCSFLTSQPLDETLGPSISNHEAAAVNHSLAADLGAGTSQSLVLNTQREIPELEVEKNKLDNLLAIASEIRRDLLSPDYVNSIEAARNRAAAIGADRHNAYKMLTDCVPRWNLLESDIASAARSINVEVEGYARIRIDMIHSFQLELHLTTERVASWPAWSELKEDTAL